MWITIRVFLSLIARKKSSKSGLDFAAIFSGKKYAYCFGRLRCLEGREGPHKLAGFSRLFSTPCRHKRLSFDTADHQHCKTLSLKTWPPLFCFITPSAKTAKAIFEDSAGKLSSQEYKELMAELKNKNFLIWSLPCTIPTVSNLKIQNFGFRPWLLPKNKR